LVDCSISATVMVAARKSFIDLAFLDIHLDVNGISFIMGRANKIILKWNNQCLPI